MIMHGRCSKWSASYSVIEASPREHRSTIFAPAFASLTTAAKASALLQLS